MFDKIFNAVAPIAKTLIEGYVNSAITKDYSPKKTDNPYSGQEILKNVIKTYNTMSQIEYNNKTTEPINLPVDIQYNIDTINPTILQQVEDTPYTLAMKKKYKYNF